MIAKQRLPKWIIFILSAIFVGVFGSLLITRVAQINIDYSMGNSSQQYLVGLAWCVLIFFGLFFAPVTGPEKKALLTIWVVRSFVSMGFMIIYETVYLLDATVYYKEALHENFNFTFSEINGSESIKALVWLIMRVLPVFYSYHAVKVIFSFFGFLGVFFFYKAFADYFKSSVKLLWFLGLFPSIIFWSSILGKDPVCFLGIGLFALGAGKLFKQADFKAILILSLGAYLMALIRIWTPIIFAIPIALSFALAPPSGEKKQMPRWLIVSLMVGVLYIGIGLFAEKLKLDNLEDTNKQVNVMSRGWSDGGSGQKPPEFNSITDMIKFMPKGIFTALLRPQPGEINNPFGLIAGFENFFILVCLLLYFYRHRMTELDNAYGRYLLATPIIWASIYGFVSYQNLGTAVRFKLQVIPFLLIFAYRVVVKDEVPTLELPEKEAHAKPQTTAS